MRNNSCTSSADRFLIMHSSSVESFIEQYSSSDYMSKYMRWWCKYGFGPLWVPEPLLFLYAYVHCFPYYSAQQRYFCVFLHLSIKVQMLWEGYKPLKKSPAFFDVTESHLDSFHLCRFDFPFIHQFHLLMTTLDKSAFWNPADQ